MFLRVVGKYPPCYPDFFLYSTAFECNTTFDWLNHAVDPIRSSVAFKFTNLGEKKAKKILENGW